MTSGKKKNQKPKKEKIIRNDNEAEISAQNYKEKKYKIE